MATPPDATDDREQTRQIALDGGDPDDYTDAKIRDAMHDAIDDATVAVLVTGETCVDDDGDAALSVAAMKFVDDELHPLTQLHVTKRVMAAAAKNASDELLDLLLMEPMMAFPGEGLLDTDSHDDDVQQALDALEVDPDAVDDLNDLFEHDAKTDIDRGIH